MCCLLARTWQYSEILIGVSFYGQLSQVGALGTPTSRPPQLLEVLAVIVNSVGRLLTGQCEDRPMRHSRRTTLSTR